MRSQVASESLSSCRAVVPARACWSIAAIDVGVPATATPSVTLLRTCWGTEFSSDAADLGA